MSDSPDDLTSYWCERAEKAEETAAMLGREFHELREQIDILSRQRDAAEGRLAEKEAIIRDTVKELAKANAEARHADGRLAEVERLVAEAATAEREACAKLADSGARDERSPEHIAVRIRARGGTR